MESPMYTHGTIMLSYRKRKRGKAADVVRRIDRPQVDAQELSSPVCVRKIEKRKGTLIHPSTGKGESSACRSSIHGDQP